MNEKEGALTRHIWNCMYVTVITFKNYLTWRSSTKEKWFTTAEFVFFDRQVSVIESCDDHIVIFIAFLSKPCRPCFFVKVTINDSYIQYIVTLTVNELKYIEMTIIKYNQFTGDCHMEITSSPMTINEIPSNLT